MCVGHIMIFGDNQSLRNAQSIGYTPSRLGLPALVDGMLLSPMAGD